MIEVLSTLIALIFILAIYLSPIIIVILIGRIIIKKKNERNERAKKVPKTGEPKWYPSGWVFNEKTQLWDPPDYLRKEAKHRWEWDQEKKIWIDKEKEARLERYRKYHEGREPTYEEWKAAKQKEEDKVSPKNQMTGEGTYRYDYIHTPNEQQQHFHHEDTTFVKKIEVIIPKQRNEEKKPNQIKPQHQEPMQNAHRERDLQDKPKTGYEEAYEAKPLLTYNEARNFKALKESADRNGYIIQAKVRLADLVMPKKGDNFYSNFGRVKSRHVDFVICDEDMRVIAVVELDDSSHDNPKAREIDAFKDSILEANKIKVIRTRHITPDILDGL